MMEQRVALRSRSVFVTGPEETGPRELTTDELLAVLPQALANFDAKPDAAIIQGAPQRWPILHSVPHA